MSDQRPNRPRSPRPGATTAVIVVVAILVIGGLVAVIALLAAHPKPAAVTTPSGSPTPSVSPSSTPTPTPTGTPTPTTTPTFDKTKLSIDQASSLWVVVNKLRPLNPLNYAPPLADLGLPGYKGQMRPEAATALQYMFARYHAQTGDQLTVVSPYRSYTSQVSVYAGWVKRLGKAQADRQSARPGHSEHQTGLAVDIDTAVSQSFATTAAGKWLAANSWRYGFILRYPDGKEPITGYEFEPWHFRFVGVPLATEMHTTKITTLEEFFGLPAAPDYAK